MFVLREIRQEDMSIVNAWRNDPLLIAHLGAPFRYINEEVDAKWFANYMSNRNNELRCAIVTGEANSEILGMVSLTNIDWISRSAVFHIMIGNVINRGKGLGSFAILQIIKHAFLNMNLERVELEVLSNNKVAQHLYERHGFVHEGRRRSAVYKNGNYEDVLVMAILRSDWDKVNLK